MAGTIDAPNLEMAGDRLFQLGYLPIKIEGEGETLSLNLPDPWQRFQKVKLEKIVSCDSVALRWRIFRNFG